MDGVPRSAALNPCVVVGEVKEPPRRPNRQRVRRVQAQEPDPRLILMLDVQADVQLREGRDPGQVRQRTSHDASHSEWDQPNPRGAFELLHSERGRDEPLENLRFHGPVSEQKVQPTLPPRPWSARQGPWPVFETIQGWVTHLGCLTSLL